MISYLYSVLTDTLSVAIHHDIPIQEESEYYYYFYFYIYNIIAGVTLKFDPVDT